MAVSREFRCLLFCTAAVAASANNWLRNNLDPAGGNWMVQGYSATGNAPATHYVASASLTQDEARTLALKILEQSAVSFPSDWDTLTRDQKIAWFNSNRTTFFAATGFTCWMDDNLERDWPNFKQKLATAGFLPIDPARA